jgi:hypothetical protein
VAAVLKRPSGGFGNGFPKKHQAAATMTEVIQGHVRSKKINLRP